MRNHVLVSQDTEQHVSWLKEFVEMGFEHIYLHNVNRNQEQFIRDFGKRVLPEMTYREETA